MNRRTFSKGTLTEQVVMDNESGRQSEIGGGNVNRLPLS
jgi:hypothetical protein